MRGKFWNIGSRGGCFHNSAVVKSSLLRLAALWALLVAGTMADLHAVEAPSAEHLRAQAARCRGLLKSSLVDFYLPACVDAAHGGYWESLRDGKFAPTGEKFLTQQGRQLWFFSTLARNQIQTDAALAAAKSGFEFLVGHMADRDLGGYFSKVTDAGEPKDTRKHVYLNSFALYGLTAYYSATQSAEALAAAQTLFKTLEDKAHDREHGGYVEFFNRQCGLSQRETHVRVGKIGKALWDWNVTVREHYAGEDAWKGSDAIRKRLRRAVHLHFLANSTASKR